MKMAFIGAGKVGTALGLFFEKKGFTIEGYFSRTEQSAEKASEMTQSRVFKTLEALVQNADLIWITTNDDAIEGVGQQLAETEGIESHIVAHVSGAHGSNLLKALEDKGCSVYSIHPLQAFADAFEAAKALEATVFTIEGTKTKLPLIEQIFAQTNNRFFIIDQSNKSLYHAGACVLSNYLVTLMDVAFNLFEQAGLQRQDILEATMPLIMSTLNNIQVKGTKQALTGPIQRGDLKTINKHIETIQEMIPQEKPFYQFMGLKTVEMIREHFEEAELDDLRNLFNQ